MREFVTVCLPPDDRPVRDLLALALEPHGPDGGLRWTNWWIGGPEGDRALRHKPSATLDSRIVRERTYPNGEPRPTSPYRCDGGPIGLLDLDFDRNNVAVAAAEDWDRWQEFAAPYPKAESVRTFLERSGVIKPGADYTSEHSAEAKAQRAAFARQPLVQAYASARGIESPETFLWQAFHDPVGLHDYPRDTFIKRRVDRVVPTENLVKLDGTWRELWDAGHDGPASLAEHDAFYAEFNEYLERLSDDCVVVRIKIVY